MYLYLSICIYEKTQTKKKKKDQHTRVRLFELLFDYRVIVRDKQNLENKPQPPIYSMDIEVVLKAKIEYKNHYLVSF